MCNVPNFAHISSVLVQRSTDPTRLLLSSRPGKGPVVWHPSKMPSSQMNTPTGRRASARGTMTIWKRERRLHQALSSYVALNSPDLNPMDYAVCGALQQWVCHRRKFNTVKELKRAIITEWQCFIDRASMSGVVVLNVLWRMAVDISNSVRSQNATKKHGKRDQERSWT